MISHRSEMTAGHLRTVVRTAFLARGLTVTRREPAESAQRQWRVGRELCSQIVGCLLDVADLEAMQQDYSELWSRLPLIASLGFEQAEFFGEQLHATEDELTLARRLAAGFNLSIVVIDHLIDEQGAGERLFRVLSTPVISSIFFATSERDDTLQRAARAAETVCERLAFRLIEWCAEEGRKVLAVTGNRCAWQDLAVVLNDLFEAERELARVHWPNQERAEKILPYLENKSVLPTIACLQIARLAMASQEHRCEQEASELARRLGNIIWRLDDAVDLIEDLRSGSPNALACRLQERLEADGRQSVNEIDIYEEVERAVAEVMQLIDPPSDKETNCEEIFGTFARSMVAGWTHWNEHEETRLPAFVDQERSASRAGLGFLLEQQQNGFEEAAHHLRFPRLDWERGYETHPALLSHRAMVLDALLDLADAGFTCPRSLLAQEVMAILKSKHPFVRGGWNYIQDVPELPPDADDLGQVLQVLMRFGGTDLASVCEDSLRLVMDSAEENGGFCTWILDPSGRSVYHERIKQYLGVMGGWGVHPEVVANLLYGLLLYDPVRYQQAIHRGIAYLEDVQNSDGFWASKWYRGSFYGTWRAVSVLKPVSPASGSLARAREFLLSSQRKDGGWGEGESEPLSTSLAMLSLCAMGAEKEANALSAGRCFLRAKQAPEGSWQACEWIAFPTIDGDVVHGSRSITTAFCLKALVASQCTQPENRVASGSLQPAFS